MLDIQTGPVLGYDTLTNVRKTNPGQTSQKPPDDIVSNNLATQPENNLATRPENNLATQPENNLATQPVTNLATQPEDNLATQPEKPPGDTARKTTRTRPGGLAAHNGLEATFTGNRR